MAQWFAQAPALLTNLHSIECTLSCNGGPGCRFHLLNITLETVSAMDKQYQMYGDCLGFQISPIAGTAGMIEVN